AARDLQPVADPGPRRRPPLPALPRRHPAPGLLAPCQREDSAGRVRDDPGSPRGRALQRPRQERPDGLVALLTVATRTLSGPLRGPSDERGEVAGPPSP